LKTSQVAEGGEGESGELGLGQQALRDADKVESEKERARGGDNAGLHQTGLHQKPSCDHRGKCACRKVAKKCGMDVKSGKGGG